MVSHDAKECSVWLASKGSLSLDQQGYGAWLRADPFSVGRKSFVFVSGTGDDFGGNDGPGKGSGGVTERRQQTKETPPTTVTSPADPNQSTEFQNTVTPEVQAPNSPTFHAGNVVDSPESFPIVLPGITHTETVNFEEQIQEIDMEISKYDSHAYGPNQNSRDREGNQSCLRTWKRLARANQSGEPAMHTTILGKRNNEAEGFEDTEQTSKRVQSSDGERFILAEVAEQPRQFQ
nr:hypothetical protein CFP56_20718 [Quercus suber]